MPNLVVRALDPATAELVSIHRLVARLRWGVAPLVVARALLSHPGPASVPLAAAVGVLMAAYNLPATRLGTLGTRESRRVILLCVAGDFGASATLLLLFGGDRYGTTFVSFTLVAVEVAVTYMWRGVAVFIPAFAAAFAALMVEQTRMGLAPDLATAVYRVSVIVLLTVLVCGIVATSRRHAAQVQRLYAEVKRLSLTDSLTGLGNRRAFDGRLHDELARASRSAAPVALLLADIDHFKRYNDRHGHQAGDDVLRRTGTLVSSMMVRDGVDSAYRYGGEEIAVILPHTADRGAATAATRMRRAFQATFRPDGITLSIGVAVSISDPRDPDVLVRCADIALYVAKAQGRNRTRLYSEALHASLGGEELGELLDDRPGAAAAIEAAEDAGPPR